MRLVKGLYLKKKEKKTKIFVFSKVDIRKWKTLSIFYEFSRQIFYYYFGFDQMILANLYYTTEEDKHILFT